MFAIQNIKTGNFLYGIDESPMVYKPMAEIVANIAETVDILMVIKPLYNYKASE